MRDQATDSYCNIRKKYTWLARFEKVESSLAVNFDLQGILLEQDIGTRLTDTVYANIGH